MKPINRGTGTTESERYLARLADKTFINLWSYPNTYVDKKQRGHGDGKELCDLLVVFGDDVLVFSDKVIAFPNLDDIKVAWKRWYRNAVEKSVAQIHGAERFLRAYQDRIYLNKECTEPFPIALPSPERIRFHGICVAIGAEKAAKKYWGGDDGSFIIADTSISSSLSLEFPFSVGDPNPEKSFVHIFDRTSLDAVLREFDTITDLIDYLSHRARSIRAKSIVAAHSERDMIAFFYQNEDEHGNHSFDLPMRAPDQSLNITEGLYASFQKRPEYKARKVADSISYAWDNLINQFTDHVLAGSSVEINQPTSAILAERALRFMAAESRVRRRALSQSLLDAISKSQQMSQDRYARVVLPSSEENPNVAYVFLILRYPSFLDNAGGYDRYRQVRSNTLETYCYAVLQDNRSVKTVVGIAIDGHAGSEEFKGGSEDLIALQVADWTDELEASVRQRRADFGILQPGGQKYYRLSAQQFPSPSVGSTKETRQQRRARERLEAKVKARQL